MSTNVDLRELAIDRGGTESARTTSRRQLLTRYVVPLLLIVGFLSVVAWSTWGLIFPAKSVTAVLVFSTMSEIQTAGTPLFQAAGWIEPRPTPIRVAALAPGVVSDLLVVEDQLVKVGDPIAELIKDDAKFTLERASVDLKLREAELDVAHSRLTAAKIRVDQPVHLESPLADAEASLAKLETQLANLPFQQRRAAADMLALQKDFDAKYASLGFVSGVEIDLAKGKLDSARALAAELENRMAALTKEAAALKGKRDAIRTLLLLQTDEIEARDTAEAQINVAIARVDQARVVVAEAELRLVRMTIRAPINGRIYRLIAHPGARVGSGLTQMAGYDGSTIVTMYRPDMLQVRVDVRFRDIQDVTTGQLVRINNAAISEPLTGQVLYVASEADKQKNTLQVKVGITDPPSVFKPEMLVDVTYLAPERSTEDDEPLKSIKLYIPQQLVQQEESGPFVWLADQSEGVARKTSIKTGVSGLNGLVEVTRGLTISSRLIVGGVDGLEDGDRIVISGEDPSIGISPSIDLAPTRGQ
jgi:RND family efflux transporter MFP subunit